MNLMKCKDRHVELEEYVQTLVESVGDTISHIETHIELRFARCCLQREYTSVFGRMIERSEVHPERSSIFCEL